MNKIKDRDIDDAIKTALKLNPVTIGVGRLCQELLSELTGIPVNVPTDTYPSLNLPGISQIGNSCGKRKHKYAKVQTDID